MIRDQSVRLVNVLSRRKSIEEEESYDTKIRLKRVLGLMDLTCLGIGSTLGLGAYVLAGAVAKTAAGPAVVLSFMVAATASAFAAMCYAEFAARVPKAGSAYVYSYVTVGELPAFIIGWDLVLEYVIGAASLARGLSNYIDSLLGKAMSKFLLEHLPIHVSFLSPYPDFLTFFLIVIVAGLIAWGVRESTLLNNVFTTINLLTLTTVVVAGSFYIDKKNWSLEKDEIPETDDFDKPIRSGEGGFMPFGVSGVMSGAATCFYGYVGFDGIATTGEEAKNPKRNIPLAIVLSLIVITIAYIAGACILTLMLPYYLQDPDAPLPHVFDKVNLTPVRYIVTIGAIFAMSTSLLCCAFPVPRVLYCMGRDRLLFSPFSKLSSRTQTPVLAITFAGLLSAITGSLFNLDQLIDMMSIGTLMAYTVVAVCVLILRYKVKEGGEQLEESSSSDEDTPRVSPTSASAKRAFCALSAYIVLALATCFTHVTVEDQVMEGKLWAIVTLLVLVFLLIITVLIMCGQPKNREKLSFNVPMLPLVPCISIFVNLYLMAKLDTHTWMRFIFWLIIGMMIYTTYGIPHSVKGLKMKHAREQQEEEQRARAAGNP
uniref:Cationic amino acid transporter C-terminal domain-containing protein n=1 Tax=Cuerna arida TaxID=1464854 RepID=A0A1B6FET5_9HEMI